ncbi:MAG: hypothetical protein QOI83_3455, partial [Streptomycetaceae bacterium]|nr:hypothetical protein [Streptomycetaceae bacterium]
MTVDPNARTASFPAGPPGPGGPRAALGYLVPTLAAAAVAVLLGVYGKAHDPTGTAFNLVGFSSTGAVKSWLASAAFGFAVVQTASALLMYGKVPGVRAPSWTGALHGCSAGPLFCWPCPSPCTASTRSATPDIQRPRDVAFAARLLLLRRLQRQ